MKRDNQTKKLLCVALIPARALSKRVPKKNIKILAGHPVLAYTIGAALDSGVFSRVIVTTEDQEIADIARAYGAEVPFMRPHEYSLDESEDIDFVRHALLALKKAGDEPECFSILRPTSPLRLPETIRRAWKQFSEDRTADSLRAVEKCGQHPAKMWKIEGPRMKPLMKNPDKNATPWHSMSYQALPETYVQNASLEIAWSRLPLQEGTIAGEEIMPFMTEGYEGFDINFPEDWIVLEHLVSEGKAVLPAVRKK